MAQLIATNNQQHVSNVTDDVGMALLHLSPNVITLRSLLYLRPNVITLRSLFITFRSSTYGSSSCEGTLSLLTLRFCLVPLAAFFSF